MSKKLNLSITQQREAVLALLRREEPAVQLARRFEISESTLYRLRDEFLAGGQTALEAKSGKAKDAQRQQLAKLKRQVEERDQVIGELTIANRIFKKLSEGSL
jgi:transposase-like protein